MAFRIQRPESAFEHTPSDKKQRRLVDDAHLAFIRKLPSAISGRMPCEACHIRYGDPVHRKNTTPAARKPDDCWTLPMTSDEHRKQHNMNERLFWKNLGIDPLDLASRLYEISGDQEAAIELLRTYPNRSA